MSDFSNIDPELLRQLLSATQVEDQRAKIDRQAKQAEALQATPAPQGQMMGGYYIAPGILGAAATALAHHNGAEQAKVADSQRSMLNQQWGDTVAGLLKSGAPTDVLGSLALATGSRSLEPFGKAMISHADKKQQALKLAAGGLDPETVNAVRPDLVEALGGPEVVSKMNSQQLTAAMHAYDARSASDYRRDALEKRTSLTGERNTILKSALGVRQKKLVMDIKGRDVPGMEMQDGYVLQPKEASEGKKLRGNVERSLASLKALREDFNKYGPDTVASLGGLMPSEALSRMEGNRARLIEAAMLLQGMNPTIGHQELLQQQLRDPASYKNLNRESYIAQLDELEKAIREADTAFAAGHGAKALKPLEKPAEPKPRVRVKTANGQVGTLPAEQVDAFLKANPGAVKL